MSIGFWKQLKRPFFVLAPMADVTDAAFRRVIAARGKPDVMWTEFVSADGLVRATPEGKAKLMKDLIYVNEERPIVAQLFSAHPEYMREAAKLVRELGFDGIDINMGCPDRSIEKQGAGAALIKTPELAREVIKAAKEGARGDGVEIPVSVKTRVGYNSVTLDEWLPEILKESPAAVTIHARTRKEMSKVPANWDLVRQAVQIRDHLGSSALILGNGDVTDIADAREKAERTGADGIMLGRAIFGNPWLFNETHPKSAIPLKEQLEALREHVQLFDEILGGTKSFAIMKKHFKAYVEGFDGAKEIREALMNASNPQEVTSLLSAMIDGTADPR